MRLNRAGQVPRDNLDALTGLRFIAAFTIVFGHAYAPWLEITAIGMPLFFTLSGFIIHYVYSEAFSAGWGRAAREFAVARFSRLYPLYFVLLAFFLVHSDMGPLLTHRGNLPALLGYLLMCWTWWPCLADGHPVSHYFISWSVATEVFFYFCYALFLYRIARIRSIRKCLLFLIIFCILAYFLFLELFLTRDIWEPAALRLYPEYPSRITDFNLSFYRWLLYLSPYCRLPEFVGGVLTCQLFLLARREWGSLDRLRPRVIGLAGIGLMAVLYAQFRYFGQTGAWLTVDHFTYGAYIVNLHQNFLFAPSCYLVIFSLACGGWGLARALASRPACFFGEISYSSYLAHEMVIAKFHQLGVDLLATAPYLAVLLAAVYTVSWILYSVIEVPAKSALRFLSKLWIAPRQPAPVKN